MIEYCAVAESKKFIVLDKYTQKRNIAESYQSEGDLEREQSQPLTHKEDVLCPSI